MQIYVSLLAARHLLDAVQKFRCSLATVSCTSCDKNWMKFWILVAEITISIILMSYLCAIPQFDRIHACLNGFFSFDLSQLAPGGWLAEFFAGLKNYHMVSLRHSYANKQICTLMPTVASREIKTWAWVMSASMAGSSCVMFLFGTKGQLAVKSGRPLQRVKQDDRLADRQAEKTDRRARACACLCAGGNRTINSLFFIVRSVMKFVWRRKWPADRWGR